MSPAVMATMTVRERLMTALRRDVPDRVPLNLFATRWARFHHGCAC
ncbi:hypothetical protein HQ590_06100 [bacterium]|nr:hypothetical protein [bacterium]